MLIKQSLAVYSEAKRDPRGHLISTVFVGKVSKSSNRANVIAQDDAAAIEWVGLVDIDNTGSHLIIKILYQITKNGNNSGEPSGQQKEFCYSRSVTLEITWYMFSSSLSSPILGFNSCIAEDKGPKTEAKKGLVSSGC